VLTNQDILDMTSAGLPPEVLIAKIQSGSCDFDTTPQALKGLKAGGISDSVILTMVKAPIGRPKASDVGDSGHVLNSSSSSSSSMPAPDSTPLDLTIPRGAKVFVEPMNGFEIYLTAAFQKKQVPLSIITNKEKADFIITGASDTKKAGWAKIVFMGNLHSDEEASVTMVNNRTGAAVFAYAVNKKNTLHGQQTSAEGCAKHLKSRIEEKN
jgi:hypothetical protein